MTLPSAFYIAASQWPRTRETFFYDQPYESADALARDVHTGQIEDLHKVFFIDPAAGTSRDATDEITALVESLEEAEREDADYRGDWAEHNTMNRAQQL